MAGTDFVINPYAITYETIRNSLRVMVSNDRDTFTDFFNDSSGSTVLDTAAAIGAFFAYHIITQRKEFTLEHATSYKSLVGNAYDKGYNVSRGNNVKLKLTVTPNMTGSISAWTVVGTLQDYDVILLNDVTFIEGVTTTINVVIGNRGTEAKTITTKDVSIFKFTSDDITDDIRLFLNGEEIEYSKNIADLMNDKYLMMTNSYGSVNVFYLNTGEHQYKAGSNLAIEYVSRNNLTQNDIALSEFYLEKFNVDSFDLLSERISKEDKETIRINAILHAETSGLIKSRSDFKKVIKELDKSILSINDEDIQPGRIGIFILKNDYEPLNDSDKERYNKIVARNSVSGVANLYYENAHKYTDTLNVNLVALNSTTTDRTLIDNVNNCISKYEGSINSYIDFNDIENYIEQELDGIKVARVTVDSKPWVSKKPYRMSDTCIATNFNNSTYYVSQIDYKTGKTEPNWNTPNEDGYIVDGDIIWKEYSNQGLNNSIMLWEGDIVVKVGTLCTNYTPKASDRKIFEAVGYVATTGESKPDFKKGDEIIFDNQVVWGKVNSEVSTVEWSPAKLMNIGDTYVIKEDSSVNESYVDNTQFAYYSDIIGNFYTKDEPLKDDITCYKDSDFTIGLGTASDLDLEHGVVTITPLKVYTYKNLSTTGNFYTKKALENDLECFSDNLCTKSIGVASNVTDTSVTITPIDSSEGSVYLYENITDWTPKIVGYSDITVHTFLGGVSGLFYTKSELDNGIECFKDNKFENKLGVVKDLNTDNKTLKIINEENYQLYSYRVIDYAVESGVQEPDWSKSKEGKIIDGRLTWTQSEYPIRFINLANNTYAKFDTNITMN